MYDHLPIVKSELFSKCEKVKQNKNEVMVIIQHLLHLSWHDEKQLLEFSGHEVREEEYPILHNTKYLEPIHNKKHNY